MVSLRSHGGRFGFHVGIGRILVRLAGIIFALGQVRLDRADDALRQEQRDEDEQSAQANSQRSGKAPVK